MLLTDILLFMLIDFITIFPQPFLVAWFLCRFYVVKHPRTFILVLSISVALCHAVLLYIPVFSMKYTLIVLMPLNFLICYLFIPQKIRQALTLLLLLASLMVTIELLFTALLYPFYYNQSVLFPQKADLLFLFLMRSAYNLVYALCIFGLCALFRRRQQKGHCAPTALGPFLLTYVWQTTLSIMLYFFYPHHTPLLSSLFWQLSPWWPLHSCIFAGRYGIP